MALQVDQALAGDIAKVGDFMRLQGHATDLEAGNVIGGGVQVKWSLGVPHALVQVTP